MTCCRFLPLAVLGLTLAALPTQGQSVPVADVTGRCEPSLKPGGTSSPGFLSTLESDCSASCEGSTSLSVSCSGLCQAQDQNCATGTPGFVDCGGVRTYCPACPSQGCSAQKYCPDGSFISCQGQSACDDGCHASYPCDVAYTVTTATYGTCYIECDGAYTLCPGTTGAYICDGL